MFHGVRIYENAASHSVANTVRLDPSFIENSNIFLSRLASRHHVHCIFI